MPNASATEVTAFEPGHLSSMIRENESRTRDTASTVSFSNPAGRRSVWVAEGVTPPSVPQRRPFQTLFLKQSRKLCKSWEITP